MEGVDPFTQKPFETEEDVNNALLNLIGTDSWVEYTDEEKKIRDATLQFKNNVVSFKNEIQNRLDLFARTHKEFDFKDIARAKDYADDEDVELAQAGAYAKKLRSDTWVAARTILRDVRSGKRPMPSSIKDIEDELPTPSWPTEGTP